MDGSLTIVGKGQREGSKRRGRGKEEEGKKILLYVCRSTKERNLFPFFFPSSCYRIGREIVWDTM